MTTYARKIDNVAVDVVTKDPATMFHPDIASQFIVVPNGTLNGATWANNAWTNPPTVVPPPPATTYLVVSPIEFKLLFTAPERVAIKNSVDPVVQDFFSIIDDPRLTKVELGLQSTQDALLYLVSKNLITAARRTQIMAGIPQ
ncbi:MAG: hypothetical protein K2Y28_08485 [Burkholderiaceae bacterium]|nr:hypothetical protein [Burkholderiaceae bacterium]